MGNTDIVFSKKRRREFNLWTEVMGAAPITVIKDPRTQVVVATEEMAAVSVRIHLLFFDCRVINKNTHTEVKHNEQLFC